MFGITLTRITLLLVLEPVKGPSITTITATATSLRVTWNALSRDDANGEITKYEVFYQLGSSVSNTSTKKTVIGGDTLMVNLTGLKPASQYTVAVQAFTNIGGGPLGDPNSKITSESGEFISSFILSQKYSVAKIDQQFGM